MKIILEETKRKKANKRWWKNNEDHDYFLMQTYSIKGICRYKLHCLQYGRNRWGRNVSSLIGKDVICCCLAKISCVKRNFSKKLSCSYESLFIVPIIHFQSKELVLPKFQKPIISNLKFIILIYPIIPWPFEPYSLLAISFAFQ